MLANTSPCIRRKDGEMLQRICAYGLNDTYAIFEKRKVDVNGIHRTARSSYVGRQHCTVNLSNPILLILQVKFVNIVIYADVPKLQKIKNLGKKFDEEKCIGSTLT
jgi:hypothetical protein